MTKFLSLRGSGKATTKQSTKNRLLKKLRFATRFFKPLAMTANTRFSLTLKYDKEIWLNMTKPTPKPLKQGGNSLSY